MTYRALLGSVIVAMSLAAASVAAQVSARVPQRGTPEQLKQLSSKPTPKLADGRTDFNGTWDHLGGIEFVRPQTKADGSICLIGCTPPSRAGGPPPAPFPPVQTDFPKYKPEFVAKVKDLTEHQVKYDTVLQCQPPGVPRIGPPSKIVQNAREVVFLYDDVNGSFFRIVPTDGRPRRKDVPASYLGDALGRIEGDTLVVETTNFNDETWLTDNGAFHTKDLKVTERFRRRGDTIEYSAIVQDPSVLAEPWSPKGQMMWITDVEIEEPARCEDRDLEHIVDGSHHDNPR
ncbi:MAG TPA: hypothetical protein VGF24_17090 [Vicinamibacterales bacterium]|jgi:hypothetical protein